MCPLLPVILLAVEPAVLQLPRGPGVVVVVAELLDHVRHLLGQGHTVERVTLDSGENGKNAKRWTPKRWLKLWKRNI